MRQGAVGQVRLVQRNGHVLVEKRTDDASRHGAEVLALQALVGSGLPVPQFVEVGPGRILMTLMRGDRVDGAGVDERVDLLRASAALLRRLHQLKPPEGLPAAPDDALIIRRYRKAGGPRLPLVVPERSSPAFCHGDWTDGNLLAVGGDISAIVDWEAAHVGDAVRELSRAAWAAGRKDSRAFSALVEGYGADPNHVRAWLPIHAAELWLWFAEAGPAEYLEQLTSELLTWPQRWR
jgi:aminoglycoside phosphotransferase